MIGSLIRVVTGQISDKTGGAILTHIAGIGLIISVLIMAFGGLLTPNSLDQFPYFIGLMLFIFFLPALVMHQLSDNFR